MRILTYNEYSEKDKKEKNNGTKRLNCELVEYNKKMYFFEHSNINAEADAKEFFNNGINKKRGLIENSKTFEKFNVFGGKDIAYEVAYKIKKWTPKYKLNIR